MTKAKKLYAYLKERYGVLETEVFNEDETILQQMIILIPGLSKQTEKHLWSMHVEDVNSNGKEDLIIGEIWKNKNSSWSRFIEIADNEPSSPDDYSYFRLRLIEYIGLGGCGLKDLKTFICIFKEFMKTI